MIRQFFQNLFSLNNDMAEIIEARDVPPDLDDEFYLWAVEHLHNCWDLPICNCFWCKEAK